MQVRLLPEYPLGIACGGIELRCLKTVHALNKYAGDGVTARRLDYYNTEDQFDILHIFGNPPSMYETCFYASKTKKVIIDAVSGVDEFSFLKMNIRKLFSGLAGMLRQHTDYARLCFIFQSSSHIICSNDFERTFFCAAYNIPKEKVTVIPNGVDDAFFSASGDAFIKEYGISDFVLFTGNIVRRKNPLNLAKALLKTRQKGVFIGNALSTETEYASAFEKMIVSSPNLLWIKGMKYDDPLLASAYAASSVFCLPSTAEVMPSSALEAMAADKPLILGNFAYAYRSPFEKALHCNPEDPVSIANCIQTACDNPKKFTCQLPVNFSWKKIAQEIVNVYKRTIAG